MVITFAIVSLGFVAWIAQALLTLQTYESRRYARSRARDVGSPLDNDNLGQVTLIVPCKDHDLDGNRNLAALMRQDHPQFELVFVVESVNDPAYQLIQQVRQRFPNVASRVIEAGRCVESAQKVHNLVQATGELPDETTILAFADSDACPPASWLRHLVTRLDEPWTGAVTGYRWFVPQNNRLSNLTMYSINSALAGLLGPGSHYVVWGGAWAIRREVFDAIDIRNAWQGTLSDDLVAHRALREANLQVRFEPKCMVTTPVDFDWSGAVEFAQRQYRISRLYLNRWWTLAVLTGVAIQAAFWGQLYVAALCTGLSLWWRAVLVTSSLGLATMTMFRAKLRQDMVAIYTPDNAAQLKQARLFDMVAAPLVAVANLFVLLSSAVGRRIRWRGITYLVSAEGRSQLLGRRYESNDDGPVIFKFPVSAQRRQMLQAGASAETPATRAA
jgi:cellulose synthase/poly-beta-1,6-N-acetylglucosamine synthase-like glycosyltransferase